MHKINDKITSKIGTKINLQMELFLMFINQLWQNINEKTFEIHIKRHENHLIYSKNGANLYLADI